MKKFSFELCLLNLLGVGCGGRTINHIRVHKVGYCVSQSFVLPFLFGEKSMMMHYELANKWHLG